MDLDRVYSAWLAVGADVAGLDWSRFVEAIETAETRGKMNENVDIKITVAGRAASGKSTIATQIAHVLREAGFQVEHDPGPDGPLPQTPPLPARVKAVADKGVSIHIGEVMQSRRSSLG